MTYAVQTPVYEGPFDLLLHLILREQVDLYEVSLSDIVDAYLVELERLDTLDLDVATEFLLIAATLVELKARRLLPDEGDVDLEGIDADDLRSAFVRAVTPKPRPTVDIAHIHAVRISVADAVTELADELPRVGRITFRALTESLVERLEVVVRFLALLELFKQGMVDLDQATAFGDIEVVWLGHGADDADLALVDVYDG